METKKQHPDLRTIVVAMLAGEWILKAVLKRMAGVCVRQHRFLGPFARRALAAFPSPPSLFRLHYFAWKDVEFNRAVFNLRLRKDRSKVAPATMSPAPSAENWGVATITTPNGLPERFGMKESELEWFADTAGRNNKDESLRLRHYTVRWMKKQTGKVRLLESPKRRLKTIQRKILREILDHIPPHPAAHGFRAGRSVVSYAGPHCGREIVLRFDLADFFPSVGRARVEAIFRTAGYPEAIAKLFAGLCTTRLPRDVWDARPGPAADGSDHATWQRLNQAHLPQGAPTSPALANLCAYRLDCRLLALAQASGATYTRYADDLAFSGGADLARGWKRFQTAVAVIALEEGFALNFRKTRAMRPGHRQKLAGVVVNVRPNIPRGEFDRLKAILTNCVRNGPDGENREGHRDFRAYLLGKIAHVAMLNPARGAKLRAIFERIRWTDLQDGSKIPAG
jgi:hypothetical protein